LSIREARLSLSRGPQQMSFVWDLQKFGICNLRELLGRAITNLKTSETALKRALILLRSDDVHAGELFFQILLFTGWTLVLLALKS
jgi:hypothetical protein